MWGAFSLVPSGATSALACGWLLSAMMMPGLLLVFNGPPVLWGRHEPDLDNWPRVARSRRKSDASWRRVRKSNGAAAHRLGCLAWFHGLLSCAFVLASWRQQTMATCLRGAKPTGRFQ